MQARERLYLTAEKDRLVRHGDRDAAFLYAAVGDEIPESAVARFGIVDGRPAAARKPEKPEVPHTPKPESPAPTKPEAPAPKKTVTRRQKGAARAG